MIDGRVLDKPVDHATRGRLRALYEWLKPATPSPHLPSRPRARRIAGTCPLALGIMRSSASWAKAGWASCTRRATSD